MQTPEEYHFINNKIQNFLSKEHQLQKIEERGEKGTLTLESWRAIYEDGNHCCETCHSPKVKHIGKYKTRWRGMILMKGPFEIVTYQQLMWDVKPRTVLEFGANAGGSAVWIADTLRMYGCDSHVYSMDIDLGLLEPLAREKRDDLTFLQGDCNEVEKTFTPELLKSLPHPWFVTEDAHVNVVGVLDYIDQFTQPGDYIVVEDTSPFVPTHSGICVLEEVEYKIWDIKKLEHMKEFVKKHPNRYRVDMQYTDFFGYNNTTNLNGYLRRI